MCLNYNVTSPTGTSPDTFLPIDAYSELDDKSAQILLQTIMVFTPVANAFGIPSWFESREGNEPFYIDFMEAGQRAPTTQSRLNNAVSEQGR